MRNPNLGCVAFPPFHSLCYFGKFIKILFVSFLFYLGAPECLMEKRNIVLDVDYQGNAGIEFFGDIFFGDQPLSENKFLGN